MMLFNISTSDDRLIRDPDNENLFSINKTGVKFFIELNLVISTA